MQNILFEVEPRIAPLAETEKAPSWLPREGTQAIGKYTRQGQHHIINIRRATAVEGGPRYVYVARLSTGISTNPELEGGTLETTQQPVLETRVEEMFRIFHYEEPALIEWFYLPCNGSENFCLK